MLGVLHKHVQSHVLPFCQRFLLEDTDALCISASNLHCVSGTSG